jgi:hypothetical protein
MLRCFAPNCRSHDSANPEHQRASTTTRPPTTRITPHLNNTTRNSRTPTMLDVEDFDAVYRGITYTHGLVEEIQSFRTALGGRSYFERLVDLLNIKGWSISLITAQLLTRSRTKAVPAEDDAATPRASSTHRHVRTNPTQQALSGVLSTQRLVATTPRSHRAIRGLCARCLP